MATLSSQVLLIIGGITLAGKFFYAGVSIAYPFVFIIGNSVLKWDWIFWTSTLLYPIGNGRYSFLQPYFRLLHKIKVFIIHKRPCIIFMQNLRGRYV